MQGIIFTAFADLVIDQFGLAFWDQLLERYPVGSGGAYTAGAQYADEELIQLVQGLSQETQIPVPDLVRLFGKALFSVLYNSLPVSMKQEQSLFAFIISVDKTIHREVARLHPHAYLPKFKFTQHSPEVLEMHYHSKRQLCHAAEGLIEGAAEFFGKKITIAHPTCMHQGAEHCVLHIQIVT